MIKIGQAACAGLYLDLDLPDLNQGLQSVMQGHHNMPRLQDHAGVVGIQAGQKIACWISSKPVSLNCQTFMTE